MLAAELPPQGGPRQLGHSLLASDHELKLAFGGAQSKSDPRQPDARATPARTETKIYRDWNKYPSVIQMDTDHDIFVVGDPHADYDRLVAVLTGAKIVAGRPSRPEEVSWIAQSAIVIFTGDLIDKWTQSLAVIALVRALQGAAARSGGRVIVLMGNHEAEFLASPNAKKVKDFATELRSTPAPPEDVAACRGDLGGFLCSLPFAARINDWFFCHAGNTAGRTMKKLISDLQAGVEKDGFATTELIGEGSPLEAVLGDHPWFEPNNADAKATLTAYASALGVSHIVQGHHPGHVVFADGIKRKPGEMFQRFGLIFLEDTGMSQGIDDSRGGVLRIPGGNKHEVVAICFDGTATRIWDTNDKGDLGKAKPCGGK